MRRDHEIMAADQVFARTLMAAALERVNRNWWRWEACPRKALEQLSYYKAAARRILSHLAGEQPFPLP